MRKLDQYSGFLTCEQIAAGMRAAQANAARLVGDAEILLAGGRYPSACSLAILSFEESGKTTVLRKMATATTQQEISELWKSYRRHVDKHILTLVTDRITTGGRVLSDFRDCVTDDTKDEKAIFDALKQVGFYTDCLGKIHWSQPSDVIDELLARRFVADAKAMSACQHPVTTREIELWTKHMQSGHTRQNLLAWATAMENEKLQPEGYVQEIAKFTIGL